jgi:hypothetical protein
MADIFWMDARSDQQVIHKHCAQPPRRQRDCFKPSISNEMQKVPIGRWRLDHAKAAA